MVKKNTVGKEKIEAIFDAGTFVELGALVKRGLESEDYEGVLCGYGAVRGKLTYAFVQDGDRMRGAFDERHAKKIERLYELALKGGAPVVGVFDSLGALVYEGAAALSGYGRIMRCVSGASGIIPQIAVIDGACSGSSEVIASMFDVVIAVKGEKEEKFASRVAENRAQAFEYAAELVSMLPSNNAEGTVVDVSYDDLNRKVAIDGKSAKDALAAIADDGKVIELYEGFGAEVKTALVSLGGVVCGAVAADGKLTAGGARKASKLVSFCDSFHIPVITLVNSEGLDAEENLAGELARLAHAYALADTAKITVVVGAAYGASFTLLGSKSLGADVVFALESAEISVLPPDVSVAFLWNDKITHEKSREQVEAEWKEKCSSAIYAAELGEVDDIIASDELRQRICACVSMLFAKAEGVPSRKHINMPL